MSDEKDMECIEEKVEVSEPAPESTPERPRVHEHNRIVLLLMVKNESRIIERCLQHALPHVDAVALLDTGSTDDTVARSTAFLHAHGIPHHIETDPFVTFGVSRTRSFLVAQALCAAQNWDPTTTYALAVDADMNICPRPAFRNYPLTLNGYSVMQDNGNIKYYNLRLMKCSHPWKCVGATHEYWSGDPTDKIPYEVFSIDDKNDGGCKADKFERDVRLLTEEIVQDPNNGRAHYYLGQSLKDLGRFDEAIQMFKRRIQLGGWVEEVWYAHYQIAKCYGHKNDELQMERWMNKAYQYRPQRAEPLYHLTKHFRDTSQHYKAYHYYQKGRFIPYPKDDVLFIEDSVYKGLFEYENTILACYVHPHAKQHSQMEIIQYINRWPHYHQNVFDNIVFYVDALESPIYHGRFSRYLLPSHGPNDEYQVSSCSIVPFSRENPNRRFLMNARYVNYSIDSRGSYHMRSADGHVKTKNGFIFLNDHYEPTEGVKMMTEDAETYPSNIEGLEDVRVFYHDGKLQCTASSKNITPTGNIVIALGDYLAHECRITNLRILSPPQPSGCEKNWVYVPNAYLTHSDAAQRMNFIYGWHPFQIGAVQDNQLRIHTVQQTPAFFTHFRGSSGLVEYNQKLYAVVHHVKYCTPRNYMHALVQFSKEMRVERYTPLFCFRKTAIEYCIGMDIQHDEATFFFSENDADPGRIHVPMSRFRWVMA